VTAHASGYIQSIGVQTLLALGEHHALTIEVIPCIGDFVLPGQDLARVWGDGPIDGEIADTIRDAFDLGHERTMQQDVGFGIQQLSDIGVRALSPAVNDPTTATVVVDNLAALAIELGNRQWPDESREDADGSIRLILHSPSFTALNTAAFAQVAHYGGADPVFTRRLDSTLERTAALVPEDRRPAILALRPEARKPAR
jgi:uncharacterized membrane protein